LVVIAAGIRPRDELAIQCGLKVAATGGIIVDDEMRTSDPRIFACGECASHKGLCYGLVAPGFQMAEVVADKLLPIGSRRQLVFQSGDLSAELKLMEVSVASLGETLNPSLGGVEYLFRDAEAYRKITIAGRRLVGAMFVGEWDQRHLIRDAVGRKRRIWKRQIDRFLKTGNLWKSTDSPPLEDWPAHAIVCNCTMTTKGEIAQAIEKSEPAIESVQRITGASAVCGSCLPLVAELCGSKLEIAPRQQYALLSASVFGLLTIALLFSFGPAPIPQSVQDLGWFDGFLESEFWKQVTGFSLLGLTVLATLLSLRKRWPRFRCGNYLHWRAFHGWVATLSLIGVYWHTGFRMGSRLNFVLFVTFLSANLIGACNGLATSLETTSRGSTAAVCRSIRPWMTWIHIVGLWPLPVLILFHILAAYFYN
jgi:nitrite reductase (NADH) large subunit